MDLAEIDEALHRVSVHVHFSAVNPLRLDAARRKFFEDFENPVLEYAQLGDELVRHREVLQGVSCDASIMGILLDGKRRELLDKIALELALGTQEFARASVALYGLPSKDLVEEAYALLALEPDDCGGKISSEVALASVQEALHLYGFDWLVQTKELINSASVRASERTVYIKDKEFFSEKFIQRLIVHEIGTHALRAENGALQPFKVFFHGLAKYLETEEGLAMVHEEQFGLLSNDVLRNYAGRVVAVDIASRGSFVDVFFELKKFFSEEVAFRLALRAKRGLSDTSMQGGLTKDYLYLQGYLRVKQFLAAGGDITDLYYGKIGIDDIPLIKKVDGMVAPKFRLLRPREVK